VDCADERNLSHPPILDKSQVIEADLIRRNFAKNPLRQIRRVNFRLTAESGNNRLYPPIRNHNNASAETRHSPFACANVANSRRSYGVLPRAASP
jgi:hypothetical protein